MQKVMLNIVGSQNDDDNIELITKGNLLETDNSLILQYNETEISGISGTKNTIIVKNDTVSLQRNGDISTNLYFEEGKKYVGNYSTLLGNFSMSIYPTLVHHDCNKGSGKINLEYELDLEGEQTHNKLSLIYTKL